MERKTIWPFRDRLLGGIGLHAEVDHIPLYLKWWGRPYLSDRNDGWRKPV